MVQLKNVVNDSVFILEKELKTQIDQQPEFEYLIPQIDFTIANYYYRKQDFATSLTLFQQILEKAIAKNDKEFEIHAKESIANVYQFLGEHQKSVDYFTEGLTYWAKVDNKRNMARSARNIAESLGEMNKHEQAIAMIDSAIQVYVALNDSVWTPAAYWLKGKALLQLTSTTTIQQQIQESIEAGDSYLKHSERNTPFEGLFYLLRAKQAFMGRDFKLAVRNGEKSYGMMKGGTLNSKSELPTVVMLLAQSYDSLQLYTESAKYLDTYSVYKDSLSFMDQEKMARSHDIKLKYKNKKAHEEMQLLAKLSEEKVKHDAYLARQEMYYLIGGLFLLPLIILFIIVLKRRAKLKWFYKQLVSRTDDLIESINYAERIQRAILPIDNELKNSFKEHFVLFKPKHIVAGDFYWFASYNEYTFLAVADCTGHGVPGALVSLVCHEALQRSLLEFKLYNTHQILDKTRELVKERLNHSNSNLKDGMDIALCRIDNKNLKVQFSGAHNPLWLIRNKEIISYRGDRQPVGASYAEQPFKSEETEILKGDQLYMFSDGYADQFGGENGKKYKTSNFKKSIVSVSDKELRHQGLFLDQNFEEWKRDFEQIDDVCVIGIKVN